MSNVFRGSWIPVTDKPGNQRYNCPFCGQIAYMPKGTPTYPTCPFCLTDMPEAEEFETPRELMQAKAGNRSCTGRCYCIDREAEERHREKLRERYLQNREQRLSNQRLYNTLHREEKNERDRMYYQEHRDEILAKKREKYAERKEEMRERQREWRAANPEKVKAQRQRARGKPMDEVEAHIRGVPVEEIPKREFIFGKWKY